MNLMNKSLTALCVSMLVGLVACAAEPVASPESDHASATTEAVTTPAGDGLESSALETTNCQLEGYFCVGGGPGNCHLKGGIVVSGLRCGSSSYTCCDF